MSKGAVSDKAITSPPSGFMNFLRPVIQAGGADANITNALMKKKEARSKHLAGEIFITRPCRG